MIYLFAVAPKTVFFFQAEDGIRDVAVTGVQTCALPIWRRSRPGDPARSPAGRVPGGRATPGPRGHAARAEGPAHVAGRPRRSEERRVGKDRIAKHQHPEKS